MKEQLDNLKVEFEGLEYEEREYHPFVPDGKGGYVESDEANILYTITNIGGNDSVTVRVKTEEDIENLKEFLSQEPKIFNDYVGVDFHDYIEVLLAPVSRFSHSRTRRLQDKIITFEVFYKGTEYSLEIGQFADESLLSYFVENIIEIRRRVRLSVKIKKVSGGRFSLTEQQVRELLFSVLFDFEYSYEIALDTIKYYNPNSRRFFRKRETPELSEEPVKLVYKKYIPELIEYLHTAEKVDYLPFKYICYFHIIEYFMEKSAYRVAAKKVKALILKPDFHIKSNHYISEAINIFKKENDRYQTDAVKLNRVFREFLDIKDVSEFTSEANLKDHFENELTLESGKNFTLPKIRFDSENEFFSSLSKRIYSLRCSIVHSNPDFDENKAIPFTPSEGNLFNLRKEIELIKEISKTIVAKNVE